MHAISAAPGAGGTPAVSATKRPFALDLIAGSGSGREPVSDTVDAVDAWPQAAVSSAGAAITAAVPIIHRAIRANALTLP